MTPTPKPPDGMSDRVGDEAIRMEASLDVLRTRFRAFGYEPVSTPIVERADHFVDRSGEDMRRRLYRFTEPGGREICLRPELTIPTVRMYTDRFAGSDRVLRSYYSGPVFRYSTNRERRHRQFTQAGVELIGHVDQPLGDAEVMALANESLGSLGLGGQPLAVNDVGFYTGLFDPTKLSPKWIGRLESLAREPRRMQAFVDEDQPSSPSDGLGFLQTLASLEPDQRHEIVEGVVRSTQTVGHFGTRSMEEIVTRTLEQADLADKHRLPRELLDALGELSCIHAPLPQALEQVADVAKTAGAKATADAVSKWWRTTEHLAAYGLDVNEIVLDAKLGRGIDYYTGLLFEFGSAPFASGGRYDSLVASLGTDHPAPAVGFAINLDHVLATGFPQSSTQLAVAVVPGQSTEPCANNELIRVATELRKQGLAVTVGTTQGTQSPILISPNDDETVDVHINNANVHTGISVCDVASLVNPDLDSKP